MDKDRILIFQLPGCEFSALIEKLDDKNEICNIKLFDPWGYRIFTIKENATYRESANLITDIYNGYELTKATKVKKAVTEIRKRL